MGSCMSSAARRSSQSNPTTVVISANGDLRHYPVPVSVSQVLLMEFPTTTTSLSPDHITNNFFICNSDRLYYDDYIPALDTEYQLQPHQIYFVLPSSKLQRPLSASDMAALAVKASVALQQSSSSSSDKQRFFLRHRPRRSSSSSSRQNKIARISPAFEEFNNISNDVNTNTIHRDDTALKKKKKENGISGSAPLGVSGSGSVRKLQRYSSRRAKMAVRSFRARLTTIYEGSVLLQF